MSPPAKLGVYLLEIKVIFGYQHILVDGVMNHDIANPNAENQGNGAIAK